MTWGYNEEGAEWEVKPRQVSTAEVRASIARKIIEVRRRIEAERAAGWARLSDETRAARARFVQLRERAFERLRISKETRRTLRQGPRKT